MMAGLKLSSPETREFWEIPVLYQDEHLLILDKPAGLSVSPDRRQPERPSLMGLLHKAISEQKPWTLRSGFSYLACTHRPEAEVSGVLLIARSKSVLVTLADLFGREAPLLEYAALTQGSPKTSELEIKAALAANPVRPGAFRVDPHRGKKARTLVQIEETFRGWSLVKCQPLTHRPHQVRVHLRHAGCPVVGDELYGGKQLFLSRIKPEYHLKKGREERPLLSRPAVHVRKLFLNHPVTGIRLEISAPLPKDMQVALKYLRRFAPEPGR